MKATIKAKHRLGLNETQRALRDRLSLMSDVVIAQMLRTVRGLISMNEAWPNNDFSEASSLPFFTIQGIADDTHLAPETVDRYVHAFIGVTQEDEDYRNQRVTVDHPHAPLITLAPVLSMDGGDNNAFILPSGKPFREIVPLSDSRFMDDEKGNRIDLPYGVIPHRIVSTRAMLFAILAPTSLRASLVMLREVRNTLTTGYELPRVSAQKIETPFREFIRRPSDAFPEGSGDNDDDQLDLFSPVVRESHFGNVTIAASDPISVPAPPPRDWRADLDAEIKKANAARVQAHEMWSRLVNVQGMINRLADDLTDVDPTVRDRLLLDLFHAKMGLR